MAKSDNRAMPLKLRQPRQHLEAVAALQHQARHLRQQVGAEALQARQLRAMLHSSTMLQTKLMKAHPLPLTLG